MKQNWWNKKNSDWTGKNAFQYLAALLAIYIAFITLIDYWDGIIDGVKRLSYSRKNQIKKANEYLKRVAKRVGV